MPKALTGSEFKYKVTISISVPLEVLNGANKMAENRQISRSEYITKLIRDDIKKQKN